MQKRIMPIPIPVLEENPIELEIHARVRRAQVDGHLPRRVRLDEKLMDGARFHGDLAVVARYPSGGAVDFNPHQAPFDAKILGLKLMKMQRRAFGTVGPIYEGAQVGWNGPDEVVLVGLPKEKASSRWRFKKFCC